MKNLTLLENMAENFYGEKNHHGMDIDEIDKNLQLTWHYLILAVVPIACIVGNCLVIAAVWTTRSLQTPTNYLLVSLAVADLVVGTCVMPFSIYLSINGLHWHLPAELCYFYCCLDVAASTSSIIHLVIISIDRLVAATKPAEYKTLKHRKRVYLAIGLAWGFSICLSLPLGTGFNTSTKYFLLKDHHCGIYSPIYMFSSSIFAFYLPCIIMSITYGYIFYTLKRRLRTIQLQEMAAGQFLGFGADVSNITTSAIEMIAGVPATNRKLITWEKPLLRKIEETAKEHASSLNDSDREQLQTILEAAGHSSSESQELTTTVDIEEDPYRPPSVMLDAVTIKQELLSINSESDTTSPSVLQVPGGPGRASLTVRRFSDAISRRKSVAFGGAKAKALRRHSHQPDSVIEKEEKDRIRRKKSKRNMRRLSEMITDWDRPSRPSISHLYSFARRESVYIARRKLAGIKDWALDLLAKLKSKQGMAIRRETRATKLVATVMLVFLVCWLPFFTLNMIKVYHLFANTWPAELENLFHWFTALGYLNSSLNFFIYSVINQKFRSSFRRLIGLRRHRSKSFMVHQKTSKSKKTQTLGGGAISKIKKTTLRKASSVGILSRRFSVAKPDIIIDEVSVTSVHKISISQGGNTTFRYHLLNIYVVLLKRYYYNGNYNNQRYTGL
uniref:G-protein coupled receptors family 1 profile domain-containing protein n=1 Tax=Acrobeloides nanus TaxID=290746 RepID=A0A914EJA1_9BILA